MEIRTIMGMVAVFGAIPTQVKMSATLVTLHMLPEKPMDVMMGPLHILLVYVGMPTKRGM